MVSNLDLVRRLGCDSHVIYFSTEGRQHDGEASATILRLCDGVTYAGPRRPQDQFSNAALAFHKLDFLARGSLGLPGRQYPFSMRYDAVGACGQILAEARRVSADVVVLPSFCVHYVDSLVSQGYRVIADAIDVLSDLTAGLLKSHHHTNLLRRLALYANFVACKSQERIFLPRCHEIWTTSPAEADVLSHIAPGVNVVVVPNSLDERAVQPAPHVRGETVGFIGTFSSAPNLEAALFLAEQVFPALLQRRPTARLRLAGGGLSTENGERLARLPYVDVLGTVRESRDFFNDCAVVALPLFVRGGVPLKLVEAMARAKAAVVSPELVCGLPVVDGNDLLVRRGATGFAEAIAQLLADPAETVRLGANARETFLRHWSRAHAEETMRRESTLAVAAS